MKNEKQKNHVVHLHFHVLNLHRKKIGVCVVLNLKSTFQKINITTESESTEERREKEQWAGESRKNRSNKRQRSLTFKTLGLFVAAWRASHNLVSGSRRFPQQISLAGDYYTWLFQELVSTILSFLDILFRVPSFHFVASSDEITSSLFLFSRIQPTQCSYSAEYLKSAMSVHLCCALIVLLISWKFWAKMIPWK